MLEIIIYFFRRKPYFFYSALVSITILYSYALALYSLELTELGYDIFNISLIFIFGWSVMFLINLKKNFDYLRWGREREKFYIFEKKINNEFDLNSQNNIFKKINFIKEFVKNNYNEKGLLSIKILMLINETLYLYIENLRIIVNLKSSLILVNDENKIRNIEDEILKNTEQNENLLNYLDEYIHELTNKNTNDKKINSLKSELEHTLNILKDIKLK